MNGVRFAMMGCASLLLLSADGSSAVAAEQKLELRGLELVYSHFGPVRKDSTYLPGERVCFRYDIYGCGFNEAGEAEIDVSCRLVDAMGKVRHAFSYPLKAGHWKHESPFVRESTFWQLSDAFRPGRYTLELTVEDRLTGEEASASQQMTVKPLELALVSPRFYCDENRTTPAPLSGSIGQPIYVSCDVVGEERLQGKIDVACSADILDKAGKSVLPAPFTLDIQLEGDKVPNDPSQHLVFRFGSRLLRAGKFTLRLAAVDKLAGRTAFLEFPLEVRNPEEPSALAAR